MRRMQLLLISLMLFPLAAWAQSDSSQQNTSSAADNGAAITVRGCLTGSTGTYVLVGDEHGKPYMLQGGGTDLNRMIRHEVEVTGHVVNQTGSQTSPSSTTTESSRTQPPGATLQVSSVQEISDTCSAKTAR